MPQAIQCSKPLVFCWHYVFKFGSVFMLDPGESTMLPCLHVSSASAGCQCTDTVPEHVKA